MSHCVQCPNAVKWRHHATYLSAYGSVEEVTELRSMDGTTHGDYANNICINREGSQATAHMLTYKDQQMKVVVKGKRKIYWSCKQIGYLTRFCPQKNPSSTNNSNTKDKSTSQITKPALEPEDYQSSPEDRWTQVTKKKTSTQDYNIRSSTSYRNQIINKRKTYGNSSSKNYNRHNRKINRNNRK